MVKDIDSCCHFDVIFKELHLNFIVLENFVLLVRASELIFIQFFAERVQIRHKNTINAVSKIVVFNFDPQH
jgi:hypothetical protein